MIATQLAESLARVGRQPAVEAVLEAVRAGHGARLAGLVETAKALVAAQVALRCGARGSAVVLLVDSDRRAEGLLEPLRFFYGALAGRSAAQAVADVVLLPAHDVLPYQTLSPHPQISQARAVALWRLAAGQARLAVASAVAAALRVRGAEFYCNLARHLERDADASLDALVCHLEGCGYERCELVERAGQYAVRGGIVDVFSPEATRPVRLELFGDAVESLREFDPATQRSVQPVERVTLLPVSEFPRSPELLRRSWEAVGGAGGKEARLAGTFPGWEFYTFGGKEFYSPAQSLFELAGEPVVLLDEPHAVEESLRTFYERLKDACAATREARMAPPEMFYHSPEAWSGEIGRLPHVVLEELPLQPETAPQEGAHTQVRPYIVRTQPTPRYHGNVAAFFAEVGARLEQGQDVIVAAATTGELERLSDLCREYSVPYRRGTFDAAAGSGMAGEEPPPPGARAATLIRAPVPAGFSAPDLRLVFYGTADLFEPLPAKPRRRPAPGALTAFTSDLADLQPGDFVVHVDHGIGEFAGLRELQAGEFMLLRYADEARLYVPLERMDLVQKYRGLGKVHPKLDRLGTAAWEARKARVRQSVAEMAEKLLHLYAARRTVPGYAYSPDSGWQREFEGAFEFEETPDQARAIEEVKRDLQRPVPMDRLLVGDVGYGKTEVAMRAAFKAVCDSRQVAVLAPTTVLAFQHWETFRRRFGPFPMRVEMLSRFRSAKEQKQVLEGLETGTVDVVIGTHRLLSRDVRFRDLGVLIVDEEQRFGVAHKERIQQWRTGVDVLTLSATPIPRTLHMALAGLRDLSLIETPPKDRLAIETRVAPFSERLVQTAIEQELARDGQVYFVHNRVQSIHSMAALLQRLVPKARIVIGHGQTSEAELENAMLRFLRGEADVLLSTSIIENGLDIPRVNTILINRADRFGLAELYQLRGRVGRADRRAYAWLLVPREASLSPTARRRLAALTEFSELGAGFRIAALDLELRGAGNLLGRQQHGHANAVGFDLFCRMLERAVAERKGEEPPPEARVTLNLGADLRIPAEYIPGETLRLRTYKRAAELRSEVEARQFLAELADRFGPPPQPVMHLVEYAVLKVLCEGLRITSVERQGRRVALRFSADTPVAPERLVRMMRSADGGQRREVRGPNGSRPAMRLDPAGALVLEWKEPPRGSDAVLEAVRNVLLQLQQGG